MRIHPKFSCSELTTIHLGLDEELALYRGSGVEGIGIFEPKLPEGEDAASVHKLRASGLQATVCIPGVHSVLPSARLQGPAVPEERVEAMCASVRRLSAFEPVACSCLTGPAGSISFDAARALVVEGLHEVARTGAQVGVPIGLEPIHVSLQDDFSLVTTIPETVALIDEVGDPNLGILLDTWNLGDTSDLVEQIRRHADRLVAGLHVADRRDPTRGWADRALPGDGIIDLQAIFGALDAGGWNGWCDLEIFSDDGTFEIDYPDSLWKLPPSELVQRGREGFLHAWEARKNPA